MADPKVSTLVITVDLACCRSFTKIRKALCKLQESEDITAILYDDRVGTVTISGLFDPLVLPCKLRRKAGCVIKDIQLKMPERKHEPKPAPPPPPPAQREQMLPPKPPALACPVVPACCCALPGRVCHCAGYSYRCCCATCAFVNGGAPAAPLAAAPCYGSAPYGGCAKIQFTCEEPSPVCSIM